MNESVSKRFAGPRKGVQTLSKIRRSDIELRPVKSVVSWIASSLILQLLVDGFLSSHDTSFEY